MTPTAGANSALGRACRFPAVRPFYEGSDTACTSIDEQRSVGSGGNLFGAALQIGARPVIENFEDSVSPLLTLGRRRGRLSGGRAQHLSIAKNTPSSITRPT
jgi:hypothetical protein